MDKEKIIKIAKELEGKTNMFNFYANKAEFLNLIEVFTGKNNSFYEAAQKIKITANNAGFYLDNIITSYIRTLENDLLSKVSYERKLKIEVVNDYLIQAENLLEKSEFHPAIAASLIGASLEEFLRNWVIEQNLDFGEKYNIDSYTKALRANDLITKQDLKDITSWAGYRNDAAHGHWEKVESKEKIETMLKGVNLFIKEYSNR